MTINGWQTVTRTTGRHAALPDEQRTEIVPAWVDVTHVDFDALVTPNTPAKRRRLHRAGVEVSVFLASVVGTWVVLTALAFVLN